MPTPKTVPANLESKSFFDVFRESGITKFEYNYDFVMKHKFRTLIWNAPKADAGNAYLEAYTKDKI